jgi:hypothetical protein
MHVAPARQRERKSIFLKITDHVTGSARRAHGTPAQPENQKGETATCRMTG